MWKNIIRWGLGCGLLYATVGTILLFLYLQDSTANIVAGAYNTLYYPTWFYFHVFMVKTFHFTYYQHLVAGFTLDALSEFVIGVVVGGLLRLILSLFRRKAD